MLLWIAGALIFFIGQIAAVLIREYCRPQKAVAWLVILFALPLAGFLLYLFAAKEYPCGDADDRPKRNGASFPVTTGNEVEVFVEGKAAMAAMLEAMAAARHHIHLEFYIIREDALGTELKRMLIRKAREGVKVRLIYDGFGSRGLSKAYLRKLRKAGVEIAVFSPLLSAFWKRRVNYRNHRKILVVDGKTGFIGGMNLGDEYLGKNPRFGYWRDTHFRLRGEAVKWIQATFLSDWHALKKERIQGREYEPEPGRPGDETLRIVRSGPDEGILELLFTLIASARRRIYIETPYFVPDPGILLALRTAALRGVDVRVIIPAVPDSRLVYQASLSHVRELLPRGIRFFRYRKGFLHAKTIICDDIACSGSTNMDMRSLAGQFEIDAVFLNGQVPARLTEAFHRDLADSEEILPAQLENRSPARKAGEVFARLLSPLF